MKYYSLCPITIICFLISFSLYAQNLMKVDVNFEDVVFPTISPKGNYLAYVYPKYIEKKKWESDEVWLHDTNSKKDKLIYSEKDFDKFEGYGFIISELKWLSENILQIYVTDGDVGGINIKIDLTNNKKKIGEWIEGGDEVENDFFERLTYAQSVFRMILTKDSAFSKLHCINEESLDHFVTTIDSSGKYSLLQSLCINEKNSSTLLIYNKEDRDYCASFLPYYSISNIFDVNFSNNAYECIIGFHDALVSFKVNFKDNCEIIENWSYKFKNNSTPFERINENYFMYHEKENKTKFLKMDFTSTSQFFEVNGNVIYASMWKNEVYVSLEENKRRRVCKFTIK